MLDDSKKAQLYSQFEEQGVERTRERLRLKEYGGSKAQLAETWLEQKDHDRQLDLDARSDASNREQISIARSAKNAAWAAAIAAIIAVIVSTISLWFALSD